MVEGGCFGNHTFGCVSAGLGRLSFDLDLKQTCFVG